MLRENVVEEMIEARGGETGGWRGEVKRLDET
jgi:hypothetical protein